MKIYRRHLNKIAGSAIAKPARKSSFPTTAYCANFLCRNLQLPVGVPCIQLACQWRLQADQMEPLNRDANMRAPLSTMCRRLLCSDYVIAVRTQREVLLDTDVSYAVVAMRKISASLAQCINNRCGALLGVTQRDVWRRLSCIARWCHHPAL